MPQCTKDYEFIEIIYEIAFGDDAINKGYTHEEVVKRITEFSSENLKKEQEQPKLPVTAPAFNGFKAW
tara:strand:+ start:2657 stop:2860 length:204 start_codon:yes stop_codon:yes gene_type:complete